MARRRDSVGEELRAIRRRLNARLYKAHKQGRLKQEVRVLEQEADRAISETANGTRNGHKSRKN